MTAHCFKDLDRTFRVQIIAFFPLKRDYFELGCEQMPEIMRIPKLCTRARWYTGPEKMAHRRTR
jgi:hypothetical protein